MGGDAKTEVRKRISSRKAFSIFPNRNIIHTRPSHIPRRRRLYTQCPPYLWGISLSHTGGRAPSPDPKLTKGGAQKKKSPRKENRTNQFFPRPRSHLLPSQIRRSHDFVRFPPLKKRFYFSLYTKMGGVSRKRTNFEALSICLRYTDTVRGNSATIKMEPVCETKAWGEILGRKPFRAAFPPPSRTCRQNTRGRRTRRLFLCYFSSLFFF